MAILGTLVLFGLLCVFLFFHFRIALIPYGGIHSPSTTKSIGCAVGATLSFFAASGGPNVDLSTFCGALALAMVLTPALAPDIAHTLGKEETYPQRVLASIKSKASGAAMIKLSCIPLAFLGSSWVGPYWVFFLAAIGAFGLQARGAHRRRLIQSSGALEGLPVERRLAIRNKLILMDVAAVVGLILWISFFGLIANDQGYIAPDNWNGWVGMGAGFLLSVAMSTFNTD